MISVFTPLSAYFMFFACAFCLALLLTGLAIASVQHGLSAKRAGRHSYIALLTARPLSLIVFVLLEGGVWLLITWKGAFASSALLVMSFLTSAVLLLLVSLLPQKRQWQSQAVALMLLGAAGLSLVSFLPADQLIFKGVFPQIPDRLFGALVLFGAGFMFMQFETVDGSGISALLILGLAMLAIPLLIGAGSYAFYLVFPSPGLWPSPVWPSTWFGAGLLLSGVGLGVLYWVMRGYQLFLGMEGRLAIGFLFAYFIFEIVLITSPFVAISLLLFNLFYYGVYPLMAMGFETLSKRYDVFAPPVLNWLKNAAQHFNKRARFLPKLSWRWPFPALRFERDDVTSLVISQMLFIKLAALAFFWPWAALVTGVFLAIAMFWLIRWRTN